MKKKHTTQAKISRVRKKVEDKESKDGRKVKGDEQVKRKSRCDKRRTRRGQK